VDASGFPSTGASRRLLERLDDNDATVRRLAPLPPLASTSERPVTADQTHRSVVVGERVVVKWFRPPMPPPHRALDLLAHLSAVGFERTATPYAAVFDGEALTALVTAYLPDAVDGYDWCVAAALAGHDIGRDLGTITADLHAALATPSGDMPIPVRTDPDPDRYPRALAALDEAVAADPALAPLSGRLRADLAPLASPAPMPRLHIHGDLHVGQVLKWRDGFAVIDFDGNPTLAADAPQPLARDFAQMRTSIEHVGQIALRRGADQTDIHEWVRAAVAEFHVAYVERLGEHGVAHLFDVDLVAPFAVEQECRELIYAAGFLPRWRYAPIGVLTSWYGEF
jgi:maltokinase